MARKRFTAEQIIMKLREAEVGLASGQTVVQEDTMYGHPPRPGPGEQLSTKTRNATWWCSWRRFYDARLHTFLPGLNKRGKSK